MAKVVFSEDYTIVHHPVYTMYKNIAVPLSLHKVTSGDLTDSILTIVYLCSLCVLMNDVNIGKVTMVGSMTRISLGILSAFHLVTGIGQLFKVNQNNYYYCST